MNLNKLNKEYNYLLVIDNNPINKGIIIQITVQKAKLATTAEVVRLKSALKYSPTPVRKTTIPAISIKICTTAIG